MIAREYYVTECCPHCETEITIAWDIGKLGYKAFCPVCGNRLMLCSECGFNCDYDSDTDSCKHNKNGVGFVTDNNDGYKMNERIAEKLSKAIGDLLQNLVRIADEENIDRDSFVKASADMLVMMSEICTFKEFGNEGCDT